MMTGAVNATRPPCYDFGCLTSIAASQGASLRPHFAMPVPVPSTSGAEEALTPGAGALASRVAAGPGAWEGEEWLADLRRESLLVSLLADGTVAAAAGTDHGH